MSLDEAQQAVLDAARAFGAAGLDPTTPNIDGMCARHILRVRLANAADAMVREQAQVARKPASRPRTP